MSRVSGNQRGQQTSIVGDKTGASSRSKQDTWATQLRFTNRLAIYILFVLTIGLFMGFILALLCIRTGYDGALVCYTVVFTPLGTALSTVLWRVVEKSRAENTEKGVNYLKAMQAGKETI